ncbi:Tyrosine-protein kinase YwqD [Crateriforma conspicua]|uniref:non-specific protein-tyrosine kinase n=2 Tax=Crateriforma conspicua TaxID=2527996 RepID=A0A5C5XXG1_9PLAN|nr:Tyrosine-protein kinase YwqD [Crateriforma conspicua]
MRLVVDVVGVDDSSESPAVAESRIPPAIDTPSSEGVVESAPWIARRRAAWVILSGPAGHSSHHEGCQGCKRSTCQSKRFHVDDKSYRPVRLAKPVEPRQVLTPPPPGRRDKLAAVKGRSVYSLPPLGPDLSYHFAVSPSIYGTLAILASSTGLLVDFIDLPIRPSIRMTENNAKPSAPAKSESRVTEDVVTLDVLQILFRQRWLIAFLTLAGLAAGVAYALQARVWYESTARVLINEKSSGLASSSSSEMVEEDILANHIELLLSRKIVGEAMAAQDDDGNSLMTLPSVVEHLDPEIETVDAVDYVIDHMEVVKGGEGGAKTARTLRISLNHTEPEDAQRLLTAVLQTYSRYLDQQISDMMDLATAKINEAKNEVEGELHIAEKKYLEHRQTAPMLFQGEGSSNVYQDKYRRLQDELIDLQIQESTIKTRLARVENELEDLDGKTLSMTESMDKLALIDSESLERLGLFAGLQISASNTAEFKATMPVRAEEARTRFAYLLKLNSEKQRLQAKFGASHPDVQDIDDEIRLVRKFIDESNEDTVAEAPFGENSVNPESLLKAYVGFLNHDMATIAERKSELTALANQAETDARELIEYELTDVVLRKEVERNEALFDGVVQQLRDVDIASGLRGYLYELLETPRIGAKSWPSLPLCGLGGLMLGVFAGLTLAVANDVRDGRFRSAAEVEETVSLPSLGRVGKLNSMRRGVRGLIAGELSPNAEALRLGRTMLLPKIKSRDMRSIGVTSSMQGDGKSTITANLAASFSQVGLSVLVVDGDLRRPTVHRYFSVAPEGGLTDLLTGSMDLDDAIKPTEADGVSVITAGASTRTPAELLQSEKLEELTQQLEERFDLVIFDLPPVLAVSDPLVVAPRIDGMVLVIRAASARRDEVMNSLKRVTDAGGNMVGCVLNTFGAGKSFDLGGGYYGYYESGYSRPTNRTKPVTSARIVEVDNDA